MRHCVWIACVLLSACSRQTERPVQAAPKEEPGPVDARFDAAFWSIWGDGLAEVNAYDLTFPRYNQLRKGIAVAIFVTEPFSNSLRVKADPGKHGKDDEFPVMKLNLLKKYQTGVYDYSDMMSAFASLAEVNGRSSATATKVSFSSQEWCGHVYSQLLFGRNTLRWTQHSYFDGQADQQRELEYPERGVPDDTLPLWARGMARPWVQPGAKAKYRMLTSLETARAKHVPLTWRDATLSIEGQLRMLRVPAGAFEVETVRATREDGSWQAFFVEKSAPRRIIRWETSEGEKADLLGSDRMKYWEMNGEGGEAALSRLGIRRK